MENSPSLSFGRVHFHLGGGGASGVFFYFLRRHIRGYSVCLCPTKRTPGLYGLNFQKLGPCIKNIQLIVFLYGLVCLRNMYLLIHTFSFQKSFAGIYVCNAKNTVKENGTGRATKYIDIKIVGR